MKSNFQFSILSPLSMIILLTFLTSAVFAGPVSHFGKLKVCQVGGKGYVCSEKNEPVLLKGPSLFWSDSKGAPFYNVETVDWFVDNMQIGVIRAAMSIRYYGNNVDPTDVAGGIAGYYFNQTGQEKMIKEVIDAAILNDIYVIVDWHSHNAHSETNLATTFFKKMAEEYKDVPNIIWEVYNEPISVSNDQINTHAKAVMSAIRSAGSENLVLIGSPNWSQNASGQASSYGSAASAMADNVAFVFHFYAGTHASGSFGGVEASNNGYAVFASEWGAVKADGDGSVDQNASNSWTTFMDNNKISNCMWSASAAPQTNNDNALQGSSMFNLGTTSKTMSASALAASGLYFRTYMTKNKWTNQIPTGNPKGNDVSVTVKDGQSVTITSAELGLTGTISEVIKPEIGSVENTDNSITYTTSPSGSPEEKVRFVYKITQGSKTVQQRITVTITDRRPILPQQKPILVSRGVTTFLRRQDFNAKDPSGKQLSFKEVSLSDNSLGAIEIIGSKKDSLKFVPNVSQEEGEKEVELEYQIENAAGLYSTATVVLRIGNKFAPTVPTTSTVIGEKPNTAPIGIGLAEVNARDRDEDALRFDSLYLDPQYPGRLEKIDVDSFVYYPEANKIGKVVLLVIVTDGSRNSSTGKVPIILTGNGTDIGDLPEPSEIPGYVPIISNLNKGSSFSIKYFGQNLQIYFAQNGFAKLDVYTLSGKNIGTLLNSYQNSGTKEISLKSLNLQKGVYILKLKQGSLVKTLRIVN